MHKRLLTLLAVACGLILIGMSSALAFSFDFGDDDDDWWRYGYYGNPNQPWVAPNGMMFYPRLPYFERDRLLEQRQWQMGQKYQAMERLGAMLYGNEVFDRTTAIQLARKIEATSGRRLSDDFHPGSVATHRSRTLLSLWSNRPGFEANAEALRVAAQALAEEFIKQPGEQEGAVMLPAGPAGAASSSGKIALSPGVWEKFNALSEVCDSCHRGFKGHSW